MTHDELLAKLERRYWNLFNYNSQDQTESGIEHRAFIQEQYFVLRAVVEYHKPYESKRYGLLCRNCDETPNYPCGTIRAIEEELG